MNQSGPVRILLVEDDEVDRMAIERLFAKESLPYDLVMAATVAEATSQLRGGGIGLVLIDHGLPDGNGLDVQKEAGRTPSIFITGTGDLPVAVEAMKAGAADFLVKDNARQYLQALPLAIESTLRHEENVRARRQAEEKLRRARQELEIRVRERTAELTSTIDRLRKEIERRKRAEEALCESEERFDLAAKGSSDGLWDWPDIHRDEEWWSARWYELLGYEDGEIAASYSTFRAFLHPHDVDRMAEAVRAHFEQRMPFDMEYRLRTKSGEYRWFRGRGQALWDEDGKPVRMSGSIQDITARKRVEKELHIGNRINGIFLTSPDERVYADVLEFARETLESEFGTFGYFTQEGSFVTPAITREIYWDRCNVAEKELALEKGIFAGIWARAIGLKKTVRSNTGPFTIPKGHVPINNTIVTPVLYRGEVISAIHLANKLGGYDHDDQAMLETIAERVAPVLFARMERDRREEERKQAEQALREAHDELEKRVEERTADLVKVNEQLRREMEERKQAEEALHRAARLASLGTLAAGIAHEINNPLQAIAMSAEVAVLCKDGEDPDQTPDKFLRMIQDEVFRCGRIVKSVLQFARQEASEKWPCHLGDVIGRARDLTRKLATDADVPVHLQLREDLPEIAMNPIEMEQVLVNLISNAIQASDPGAVVTVRAEKVSDAIRVQVQDQGCGMTREQADRAFDPFFTTRQQRGGTGLGLSITHRIVEDHGGTAGVKSSPGNGTTFTLVLPLALVVKA